MIDETLHSSILIYTFLYLLLLFSIGIFGIFQWHSDIYVMHFDFHGLIRNMVLTSEY